MPRRNQLATLTTTAHKILAVLSDGTQGLLTAEAKERAQVIPARNPQKQVQMHVEAVWIMVPQNSCSIVCAQACH